MIQLAVQSDLLEIKQLTEACAVSMQEMGIFQWNEYYPSLKVLEQDIVSKELYIIREEPRILGLIALTPKMDEEYIPVEWLTPNKNNLYVHRLGVHPEVWSKGYGQQLMNFAEEFAKKHGYTSVRLDTFSQNTRNHRFYEARGYVRLGDVYFPKQSEHPFHCYEKVLD